MYLTLSPETNWIVGWVVYVDISVDIPFMVSYWIGCFGCYCDDIGCFMDVIGWFMVAKQSVNTWVVG